MLVTLDYHEDDGDDSPAVKIYTKLSDIADSLERIASNMEGNAMAAQIYKEIQESDRARRSR